MWCADESGKEKSDGADRAGGAFGGGEHLFRLRIGGGQQPTQAAQAQEFSVHGV